MDPATAATAEGRPIPVAAALAPVLALVASLGLVVIGLPRVSPGFAGSGHLPLLGAAAVAAGLARVWGWRWATVQEGILRALGVAMPPILILLAIGALIGVWLTAGIVPALVDWGLRLLHPRIFLPASCAVCTVVSLVTGSSWSTAGTVGLALAGAGEVMGIEPAWVAGAVISGAYMGDKLSPLSDTTNLAPAMAGTELFSHIRHMLWTTLPAWALAMVGFGVLGSSVGPGVDPAELAGLRATIEAVYAPSLVHLAVPIAVAAMVARQVPALPALCAGVALGGLLAIGRGVELGPVLASAMDGHLPATGDSRVDELLARGGLRSMTDTVLLIMSAMVFGGVMERTGMLATLARAMLRWAKSTGALVLATLGTGIGMNVLAADQYIAIVVPGRMYAAEFRARGLHPKNLSRALEDSGTITSVLVPWNTCGAFMATTLGVATVAYLPFCWFNLLSPVISALYGLTGWTLTPLAREPPARDASAESAL